MIYYGKKIKDKLKNFLENDNLLNPDEIAKTYLQFHEQDRSAWAWEIELRPWI